MQIMSLTVSCTMVTVPLNKETTIYNDSRLSKTEPTRLSEIYQGKAMLIKRKFSSSSTNLKEKEGRQVLINKEKEGRLSLWKMKKEDWKKNSEVKMTE